MTKQKQNKKKAAAPQTTTPTERMGCEISPFFTKKNLVPIMLLLVLPFALYWQTYGFGYVLDDKIVITNNDYTQKGFSGIWDIFTTESFQGYFGEKKNLVQGNRYRPLSIASFAVEQGLWGSKPGRSHFINVLLYALTGLLIYRLMALLFYHRDRGKKWYLSLAFATALLYIVHPMHSEAVANIKGRDEILAMLLSLATLYVTVRYVIKPKWSTLIGAAVLFFLGLLAKENTITFLAVIPLTLWLCYRSPMGQLVKVAGMLLGTTAIYLGIRFSTAGVPQFGQEIPDLMNNPFLGMSGGEKMAAISYTFAKYLKLDFLPYPLSHDYYPYAIPRTGWADWVPFVGLLTHVGAGIWALLHIRKRSIVAYSILFYIITFSIASNVVINLGTFMNERFVYMASLGVCLGLAYAIVDWLPRRFERLGERAGMVLLAAVTLVYSAITLDRVPAWESALALNRSAVQVSSNSARANSFMSTALFNDYMAQSNKKANIHLLDEGQAYVDRALDIFPSYGNANTMRVGIASERYKVTQNVTPLLATYKKVMRVRPDLSFMTEFLKYLNGRGIHRDELLKFYTEVGNMLANDYRNPKWGLHYMLLGLEIDYNNNQLNQSIANAYQLVGDSAKAQQFLNRIR